MQLLCLTPDVNQSLIKSARNNFRVQQLKYKHPPKQAMIVPESEGGDNVNVLPDRKKIYTAIA
jgi:hypothetical protein